MLQRKLKLKITTDDKVWINGKIRLLAQASISVEDRGFQFADGVYEVVRIVSHRLFMLREHLERLGDSCEAIGIYNAFELDYLSQQICEFVQASSLPHAMIYLQITRGVASRNHIYKSSLQPTILFYIRKLPAPLAPGIASGMRLLPLDDERWKKCWIKSIALLPNVLAKNQAVEAGCDEAVFIDNHIVTEGSGTNIFAVIKGQLITHPVGEKVLPGITRMLLLELCKQLNLPFTERPFTETEARNADELFITSTTREISWASHWKGEHRWHHPGPITMKLHQAIYELVCCDN